jgi:YHS domain-containing protein
MKNLAMKKLQILILFFLIVFSACGQKPEIYSSANKAINGYDPVAYFTVKKPVKGSDQLKSTYKGANWHFSSAEHKKLFDQNPEKFVPQYGGYCAFGMAQGYKATTTPEAWTIVNEKLYLNYSLGVQNDWQKDQTNMIQKADKNWNTVKSK